MRRLAYLLVLAVLLGLSAPTLDAQDDTLEGRVLRVVAEETVALEGGASLRQELEVLVISGPQRGQVLRVETGVAPTVAQPRYREGDRVLMTRGPGPDGRPAYVITDFVRRDALAGLFALFVILTLVVCRGQGARSLLGLLVSFAVIFGVVLPNISAGYDPILVALASALIVAPTIFYISHGFNAKTTVAIVGTLAALALTGWLAQLFVEAARLSGYAAEEASFLQLARQGAFNVKGLLLAGIIIGTLGVLDDITISQASLVQQLKAASVRLSAAELFGRAMSVGRDHIAALVNTLVLVYTGAALPLLLLFVDNPRPISEVINYEMVSEEIVRTLVGSIGLIAAVPLTTLLAIAFVRGDDTSAGHTHEAHLDPAPRRARRLSDGPH